MTRAEQHAYAFLESRLAWMLDRDHAKLGAVLSRFAWRLDSLTECPTRKRP